MAENLVTSVQSMLKEELWTREAINNYTQSKINELSSIIDQARSNNCVDEVLAVCEEHLSHTKESIIALYLAGILSIQKDRIDNSYLITLVDIFQKNHKEAIVVKLCEDILSDDENNKFALRTLAECYVAEGKPEVWGLYEKIVKIDFKEAELAKVLADHYSSLNDMETAINYYKKSILRYINIENYNASKELWSKLVTLIPEEIDFFQLLRRKIAKRFSAYKTTTLMQELYDWYKQNEKWDTAISILKQNLEVEPKDSWARKELVDCYTGKYKGHSHLDEYIKSSNLNQNYRNVFEAINDFEKHIAFDKNNYVFHRNWGVGQIKKLEKDTLTIYFGEKEGAHNISLKMAVSALQPLARNHIWVLKRVAPAKLVTKVKTDKVWALETIIKSFDNNCDFKKIKAELVPEILTPGEWTSWNSAAKKILDTNAKFGVNPNDINMYTVRDHEISTEEKLSNEFKAQKQFFARVDILMKFFENDETNKSSELFTEMLEYFTGYLKNISKVTEQVLASYLVIKHLGAIDSQFDYQCSFTFAELYNKIENPRQIYELLKDTKNTSLRKDFIKSIRMLPDWNVQYIRLFPTILDGDLLKTLVKNGFTEDVQKLVRTSFEQFKDYRETVLFFFKECQTEDWYKEAGVSYERQIITLINLIELTFREINNHVNSTENKKINKNATLLLFKDNAIFEYMFSKDKDTVKKLYTLIDDIQDIDPSYKSTTRNKILEKYPDFKFRVSNEKSAQPTGMLVTAKKLEEKKAEAEKIEKEELPANAKDLSDARAKGDLKENAEYHAAKERQHYLSLSLDKLKEELARATVFDPSTSTTAIVSFGTKVVLLNNDTNKEETFTILGPWESNPDENIISYMSPFGNAIMDKKVDEKASFTINEHKYNYTIKSIEKAIF